MHLPKETIGLISGVLVVISVIPYALRTWQGKITPNITSWALWSLVGLILLLTYQSSGAKSNVWPAVFGFTNPLLITVIAIIRKGEKTKFTPLEWACAAICLASLGMWFVLRRDPSLAQYALYVGILADGIAAIPTLDFVTKHPDKERPFPWAMFGAAYILALFAITDHTPANYALPIWMFLASGFMAFKLAQFRVKTGVPLAEWI